MKKPKQLEFKKIQGWGGKRKGAGRPNRSGTVNHMAREKVDFKKPLHLTLKVKLKDLRTPKTLTFFKQALKGAQAAGLNTLHYSVQYDHIHLIAECQNNKNLETGMKSLGGRFAKAVRKFRGGKGSIFKGRFHMHVLRTPRETKNALSYVLLNSSKHQNLIPYNDDYSSANSFNEWRQLLGREIGPILSEWKGRRKTLPDYLTLPRSWLAREGWSRAA